jgi:hypothetical protein
LLNISPIPRFSTFLAEDPVDLPVYDNYGIHPALPQPNLEPLLSEIDPSLEIQKVILGVLAGLIPNDAHHAMRVILDFIYYAQLPTHTSYTLLVLDDALNTWHHYKEVFVRLGVRKELLFRINKIHSMERYVRIIMDLGSADGFSTELPERLHIEYAKTAYRSTNRKQYLQQMCTYLSKCEAIAAFAGFLAWATSPLGLEFDTIQPVCPEELPMLGNGIPPVQHAVPR